MLSLAITLGCLILIVMPAVKFDDEMLGGAEEIDDVRTDRGLPPEMRAVTGSSFSARHRTAHAVSCWLESFAALGE